MSDERGAILIWMATMLPVMVVLGSFVVDVSFWWVHKRHLQVQADAAALAAARNFKLPDCQDGPILNEALRYSGDVDQATAAGVPPPIHNPQYNVKPEKIFAELNSQHFYERPDFDTDVTGGPCTSKMIDVKMTEKDAPWFMRVAGVDYIDAQARVSLQRLTSLKGLLPIGVEDVNPKKAWAIFVDESKPKTDPNYVLKTVELDCPRPAPGKACTADPSDSSTTYWQNATYDFATDTLLSGTPATVNVNTDRIGVRIALSGKDIATPDCSATLVVCYDAGSDNGLSLIQRYDDPGTVAADQAPKIGQVALVPVAGGCAGAYFNNDPNVCTIQVSAEVKFQPGLNLTNDVTVRGHVEGNNGQDPKLNWDPVLNRFVGTVQVKNSGPRNISIEWSQTEGTIAGKGCPQCKDTFSDVHRTFRGTRALSGPIKKLIVSDYDAARTPKSFDDVNTIKKCSPPDPCNHDFIIRIGLQSRLELADPAADPVALRVFSGSQNQSLDCDPIGANGGPAPGLREEIAQGCGIQYNVNGGDPAWNCTGMTVPALKLRSQPWKCVAIQTGTNANAPAAGLNERFYGSATPPDVCPPDPLVAPMGQNQWVGANAPPFAEGDVRLVPVFLVPFGTFDGSGSEVVPVIDFAFFYVTGYTSNGNGFANPCKSPPPGTPFPDVFVPGTENDSGAMSGHFWKYIPPNLTGGSGEECDFNSVTPCIGVLTR